MESQTFTFFVRQEQEHDFVCIVEELGIVAHGTTKQEAFAEASGAAALAMARLASEAFLEREQAQASA